MKTIALASLGLLVATACGGGGEAAGTAEPAATSAAAPVAAEPTAAPPSVAVTSPPAGAGKRAAAPAFTLPDLDGKPVSLASFQGKTVVLEWFNPECPFVAYAHGEGPLKDMARQATAGGVVWLSINSNAPGEQGHGPGINREAAKKWGMANPVLLDMDGAVGRAYGAKATPHMFVIAPAGDIVYRGALDDAPRGRAPSAGGVNYVEQALAAVAAGKDPDVRETAAYGCSVKYAD
jgi:peroxiredoxin